MKYVPEGPCIEQSLQHVRTVLTLDTLFPWNTILGMHYGCGIAMHERFLVHLQLCFVVSFVLRVTGLEEGVILSGKALGWTTRTLIWMPGTHRANAQIIRHANIGKWLGKWHLTALAQAAAGAGGSAPSSGPA